MINQNYFFHIFVTTSKASNNKNVYFKFENESFTKLPKKILMIRHVTDKVIINLKWRKCNKFFKPLIKGNIKYTNH